ncbi:MAG: hypothetical protein ACTSRZ_17055, partial [Promethearchaeota archaeon]
VSTLSLNSFSRSGFTLENSHISLMKLKINLYLSNIILLKVFSHESHYSVKLVKSPYVTTYTP